MVLLIIDKSKLLLDKGKFLHLMEENVPLGLNGTANCFHHTEKTFYRSFGSPGQGSY